MRGILAGIACCPWRAEGLASGTGAALLIPLALPAAATANSRWRAITMPRLLLHII
jgi:hypothetical protein